MSKSHNQRRDALKQQLSLFDVAPEPPEVQPVEPVTPAAAAAPAEEIGPPPQLITSGLMAARFAVRVHRIEWILATRPDIRPVAYAGRIRLYDSSGLARVRYELNRMDARRDQRNEGHQ